MEIIKYIIIFFHSMKRNRCKMFEFLVLPSLGTSFATVLEKGVPTPKFSHISEILLLYE